MAIEKRLDIGLRLEKSKREKDDWKDYYYLTIDVGGSHDEWQIEVKDDEKDKLDEKILSILKAKMPFIMACI